MARATSVTFPDLTADMRQSAAYRKYMESIGWKVVEIPKANSQKLKAKETIQVFVKKVGPVGLAKLQRFTGEPDWQALQLLAQREHLFMIKAEPVSATISHWKHMGFRIDGWPLLGTKTLRVDLRPAAQELLAGFKKDCRYVLRKLQTPSSMIQIGDFEAFYSIWQKSAKRKKLWIPGNREYQHLVQSFGKQALCITIDNAAGALILLQGETAFYYYAGSTTEGVQRNLPYAVVWQGMLEAKKRGCVTWDFEGLYDPRWPNKGWKGFSHFKKSFGGAEVEYPGCFSMWRWPY